MKLYRYELNTVYSPELELITYDVRRETDKCYVIKDIGCWKDKFVLKKAKSKFAYETKEEALNHYIKRTEFRIEHHLNPQLKSAKTGLALAKELQGGEKC